MITYQISDRVLYDSIMTTVVNVSGPTWKLPSWLLFSPFSSAITISSHSSSDEEESAPPSVNIFYLLRKEDTQRLKNLSSLFCRLNRHFYLIQKNPKILFELSKANDNKFSVFLKSDCFFIIDKIILGNHNGYLIIYLPSLCAVSTTSPDNSFLSAS